ncbi:MAG: ABC transporter permease, partial [Planctomycetes bacterium]|nr:ABC transporter permease [Planctomycetota bacterium]
MRAIAILAAKDLRLLAGDPAGMFFVLVFPILCALLFGTMFSGADDDAPRALSLLVIDRDDTDASRQLLERLNASGDFVTEPTTDETDARRRVRTGAVVAFLRIPVGFERSLHQPFWGEPARLELCVDPSHRAERGLLQGLLLQQAYRGVQDAFADPAAMRRSLRDTLSELESAGSAPPMIAPFLTSLDQFLASIPALVGNGRSTELRFEPVEVSLIPLPPAETERSRPLRSNAYTISFPQGVLWGILSAAATFGISLVVERSRGTLVRLRIAPLGRAQILGGKALACFATTVGVAALLFTIGA